MVVAGGAIGCLVVSDTFQTDPSNIGEGSNFQDILHHTQQDQLQQVSQALQVEQQTQGQQIQQLAQTLLGLADSCATTIAESNKCDSWSWTWRWAG